MSAARLTSDILVSALIRQTQAQGGFAMVLHRGDAQAGAILVECADRGQKQILLERSSDLDGRDIWRPVAVSPDDDSFDLYVEKRRRSDPDMWVIELDIADAQQLAANILSTS